MLQSQHSLSSTQKTRKNYSRKELIEWIAKQSSNQQKTLSMSFNQNSLKNGVFFLVILQKVIPQDSNLIKSKMKQKPVTEYDFEKNLVLVKKVLDKYSFSFKYTLDVNQIVKNKGVFDFLNWIKNVNDGLITRQQIKQESQQQMTASKLMSPQKKPLTPHSGYKTNREQSSSKGSQKPHSQAKSSRNYSASKSQNPFYKIKSGKNLVQIGNKELPVLQNNRSHVVAQQQQRQNSQTSKMKKSLYMSEWDSLDDCNQALYQLALEENIQTFQGLLRKVKAKVSQVDDQERLCEYLEKISAVIFGRK